MHKVVPLSVFVGEDALSLVGLGEEHAKDSLRWMRDREGPKSLGLTETVFTLEGEQDRVRDILADEDTLLWVIQCQGQAIGNTCLNDISDTSQKFGCRAANLVTFIGDAAYRGKGFGKAVNRTVIDWAFGEGGFEVITARAFPDNVASVKMLEALDFERVGEERELLEDGSDRVWWTFCLRR